MSPEVYWILFALLVILLAILSMYLVVNIGKDFCLSNRAFNEHTERAQERELVKYHFDKNDVEDLTKMEGDFKTVVPHVTFTNEVENTKIKSLLKGESKYDENISQTEIDAARQKPKFTTFIGDSKTENNYESFSNSVDNLECCDPTSIDVLKSIHNIEMEAREIDSMSSLAYISELKYYELNEKFIRLQINLCDIYCDREELRKRKAEVSEFIKDCQQKIRRGRTNTP